MVPQNHDNNTKLWSGLEEATRSLAKQRGEFYVITGPIFSGTNLQRIGGRVLVPTKIYKVIYDPSSNQGAAYLVDNAPGNNYQIISISQVEQLANIRLFPKMTQAAIKNNHSRLLQLLHRLMLLLFSVNAVLNIPANRWQAAKKQNTFLPNAESRI